jgi:nicotinate-nucleotide adenylyltransferase
MPEASRVGILGGTFDPIHIGHLAAAAGVRHALGLERVLFLPNRQPPHKPGRTVSPAADRLEMVRLAVSQHPFFAASALEVERSGPSYTVDTLTTLAALHPDWELFFIAGADSLLEITTWHQYREVLRLAWFVAVSRPGYPLDRWEYVRQALGSELAGRVIFVDLPVIDLSAEMLRQRVGQGAPITYLVPPAVEAYIEERGLYRQQTEG